MMTLEGICKTVGYPKTIRVDHGSESIPRSRHLGLPEGCRAGFLAAEKADGQQLHRIL